MIELGVNQRGVQRAMPQNIGYFLERAAALQQLTREGMAQLVGTAMGQADTTVRVADNAADGIDTDRLTVWCYPSDKDRSISASGSLVAQILGQGSTGSQGQRQKMS